MSSGVKPTTIDEYERWLTKTHGVKTLPQMPNYFKSVAEAIRTAFENSAFWQTLCDKSLKEFDERYKLAHDNYPLLISADPPQLCAKSYASFLQKTFRYNVLQNREWPAAPIRGGIQDWLLPSNWMTRINDIIRCCFVVKYLDGVESLMTDVTQLATSLGLTTNSYYVAEDDGYYAAHAYISFQVDIPKLDWDTTTITATIELQVTTQLQDVIRRLLHRHYEARRAIAPTTDKWQWNYSSDEFATNYLGHILHYAEGMIVDVRDNRKGKRP